MQAPDRRRLKNCSRFSRSDAQGCLTTFFLTQTMRNWIRQKRNQVFILMLAGAILLLNNFGLPRHEQLAHHKDKIAILASRHRQLSQYALHTEYHETRHSEIQAQRTSLQQSLTARTTAKTLQQWLGQLQRQYRLKVIRQKVEEQPLDEQFGQIEVQQTLSGTYVNLHHYLEAVMKPESLLILEDGSFENQAPLDANPTLLVQLTFKSFYLKP